MISVSMEIDEDDQSTEEHANADRGATYHRKVAPISRAREGWPTNGTIVVLLPWEKSC